MYHDYKTSEDRLPPPRADWVAVAWAIVISILFAWILIEFFITPDAFIEVGSELVYQIRN